MDVLDNDTDAGVQFDDEPLSAYFQPLLDDGSELVDMTLRQWREDSGEVIRALPARLRPLGRDLRKYLDGEVYSVRLLSLPSDTGTFVLTGRYRHPLMALAVVMDAMQADLVRLMSDIKACNGAGDDVGVTAPLLNATTLGRLHRLESLIDPLENLSGWRSALADAQLFRMTGDATEFEVSLSHGASLPLVSGRPVVLTVVGSDDGRAVHDSRTVAVVAPLGLTRPSGDATGAAAAATGSREAKDSDGSILVSSADRDADLPFVAWCIPRPPFASRLPGKPALRPRHCCGPKPQLESKLRYGFLRS